MSRMLKYSLVFLSATTSQVLAQNEICGEFLKNPVFTKEIFESNLKSNSDFKSLLCSANWRSASEAQGAGIDVTVPIYNIPVPISANWNNSKVEQWKSANCSTEERKASYQERLYNSVYKINPISADTALQCVKAVSDDRAIRCSVTEGEGSAIFQVEWRRTSGEDASAAPMISSLTVSSAECLNLNDLSNGVRLSEGGVSLLCKRGDNAPLFTVNTSRGQCFAYGISKLDIVELAGDLILDRPTTIKAARIKIRDNFRAVTLGYPLQITADDTLEIAGSPQIVSFPPGAKDALKPGKPAGTINIKARKIQGGGLSIINVGEDGGPGTQGQKGPTGTQGGPGQGRDPISGGGGGGLFGRVLEVVPKSCTGGKGGGTGTKGGKGLTGLNGAPGGAAGQVILSLPAGAEEENAIKVLTDVGIDAAQRACGGAICGGIGGAGGTGGPGGDGGPGGPGAPGTTWCGGTSAGDRGPTGDPGDTGGKGDEGPVARVQYN
ncbi:hypothetical protein HFN65_31580 [Rhizobium laguerreae]|uniref:hypothetical protein n=1 Tax=Rhizobium laguerreae TaxID=1076926 RepID=UPI001C9148E2|nr:hypothetical protein [Rhizobium laguerreae]MBY3575482.1 hypothetical protein [Rhizobium laguerreae]